MIAKLFKQAFNGLTKEISDPLVGIKPTKRKKKRKTTTRRKKRTTAKRSTRRKTARRSTRRSRR